MHTDAAVCPQFAADDNKWMQRRSKASLKCEHWPKIPVWIQISSGLTGLQGYSATAGPPSVVNVGWQACNYQQAGMFWSGLCLHSRCLAEQHITAITRLCLHYAQVCVCAGLTWDSSSAVWRSRSRWCSPWRPAWMRWFLQQSQHSDDQRARRGGWGYDTTHQLVDLSL